MCISLINLEIIWYIGFACAKHVCHASCCSGVKNGVFAYSSKIQCVCFKRTWPRSCACFSDYFTHKHNA